MLPPILIDDFSIFSLNLSWPLEGSINSIQRMTESQIEEPEYAYITDHFGIKVLLFFSINDLTRIFAIALKLHPVYNIQNFLQKPNLEILFF